MTVKTPEPPLTPEAAAAHLVATDPRFALTRAVIRGVEFPVFVNVPDRVDGLIAAGRGTHGPGDFLIYQDERWTHAAFEAEVARLTRVVQDLGVTRGQHVAIAMRNYPELVLLMMALSAAGAVSVLLNAWWTAEELDYAFRDSGARLVFADGPRAERIETLAPALNLRLVAVRDAERPGRVNLSGQKGGAPLPVASEPEDDFTIMYSSGSTGHPKGVVLTHRSAVSSIYSFLMGGEVAGMVKSAAGLPAASGDVRVMIVTPLFHVTATHPLWLQSLVNGASVVLLHKWDPEEAVRTIRAERVTRMVGVPTQAADLIEAARRMGVDMPTLDYLGAGGAKRPPVQVAEQAAALPGVAIASGWGMTETNALGVTLAGPAYEERPNAAGKLIPPLQQLKIVGDNGQEMPQGVVGEIAVKSPANMRCYLNKPEETAEVLQDGWLFTGDLGSVDAEGVVTIVDRKKSIIIRAGENISCLEVEAALHRHPAVLEAGVFPVPDARLGEAVGAAVQLRPGETASADALCAFLREHIAGFKVPGHMWFRDTPLPRGATDKIDRRTLRAECLADHAVEVA